MSKFIYTYETLDRENRGQVELEINHRTTSSMIYEKLSKATKGKQFRIIETREIKEKEIER